MFSFSAKLLANSANYYYYYYDDDNGTEDAIKEMMLLSCTWPMVENKIGARLSGSVHLLAGPGRRVPAAVAAPLSPRHSKSN